MEIRNIYEHIDIDTPAYYQVKVKGDLKRLMTLLKSYNPARITSETTDSEHQVYMITLNNMTQTRLFGLVSTLLHYQYPVIAVNCTHVTPKKTDTTQDSNGNNKNGNDPSIAISA